MSEDNSIQLGGIVIYYPGARAEIINCDFVGPIYGARITGNGRDDLVLRGVRFEPVPIWRQIVARVQHWWWSRRWNPWAGGDR